LIGYFGQNKAGNCFRSIPGRSEQSLSEVCKRNPGLSKVVLNGVRIAVDNMGFPALDLSKHCRFPENSTYTAKTTYGMTSLDCNGLAPQIKACQKQNIKVYLGICKWFFNLKFESILCFKVK
jgi:hypothetical protein